MSSSADTVPGPETVHLILFSRAPEAGRSKTRLAAAIGPERAMQFHAHCLNDLLETCLAFGEGGDEGPPARSGTILTGCHLFVTPPGSEAAFGAAGVHLPSRFQVYPQWGADLGARMADAFQTVLGGAAPHTCALLFGSDLPLLDVRHLDEAVAALRGADVALGPSTDGGYYLIGMKAPHPALFDLERWGGGDVLAETERQARAGGLTTARIATLPDLDTAQDVARVRAHPLFRELAHRRACRFLAGLRV
jgi:rSAM/selenodomain-associated transferase 1